MDKISIDKIKPYVSNNKVGGRKYQCLVITNEGRHYK